MASSMAFAPARADGGADEATHRVRRRRAFVKRRGGHGRHRVDHLERVIQRQPHLHVVDGFTGLPFAAVGVAREVGLGVLDAGLDVPQPVGAQVAAAHHAPRVDVLALDGRGKAGVAGIAGTAR